MSPTPVALTSRMFIEYVLSSPFLLCILSFPVQNASCLQTSISNSTYTVATDVMKM